MNNAMHRIKWENITLILSLLYGIATITHHVQHTSQAFTTTAIILLEAPIYISIAIFMRFITKKIRVALR